MKLVNGRLGLAELNYHYQCFCLKKCGARI